MSDILSLHSELKFDARNEFSGTKTHENHVSHYHKQFSRTRINTTPDFQYGYRRPSWIFKNAFFGHSFFSLVLFTSCIGITRCYVVNILNFTSIRIILTFQQNPIWPPAAILKFNSKLDFDVKNEFSGMKSYENHVSH